MIVKNCLGWTALLALIGSGVAACSGADVSSDPQTGEAPVGELQQELRARKICGGREPQACGKGEYCSSKPGKCPDRHRGRCAAIPEACTKVYAPVCGCDGVTYGNDCEAAAAGVSVASKGECEPKPSFCGGIAGIPCPPGQQCVDNPSDGCDPQNGGADCGGICIEAPPTHTFCGGIAGIQCPDTEQCVDDPNDSCDPKQGGADCGGICVAAGEACGDVTCGSGTVCCNPLRGLCTKPGMLCIQ